MNTRERIRTYAMCGGAWEYLKKELTLEGLSENFAAEFISRCRYRLGTDTADFALLAYDKWVETGSEEQAKTVLLLIDL